MAYLHLSVVIVAWLERVCGYEKELSCCFDEMGTRYTPTIHGGGV